MKNIKQTIKVKNKMNLLKISVRISIFLMFFWAFPTQTQSQQKDLTAQQSNQSIGSGFWVTSYYALWSLYNYPPSKIDYTSLTHIIVFSYNPDPSTYPYFSGVTKTVFTTGHDDSTWWHIYGTEDDLIARAHANGVKVLMCLGGIWGTGASNMAWIAADSIRTQAFANSALAYARRHGYDGVDLDWEQYIVKDDYSRFLRIFRRGLNTWNPVGLFSTAAGYTPSSNYDITQFAANLDQVNIMTYDYNLGNRTWFNSPLRLNPTWTDFTTANGWSIADHGPAQWIAAGFPANKLAIALPFYTTVNIGNDRPNQPNVGNRQFRSYQNAIEARAAYRNDASYAEGFDEYAKCTWFGYTAGGTKYFWNYDDSLAFYWKVKYSDSMGLGGIMIFQLGDGFITTTQTNPLLTAVKNIMNLTQPNPTVIPDVPTLSTPINNATNIPISTTLAWNSSTGATTYGIQVSINSGFTTTLYNQTGIYGTSFNVSGLANNTLYYWRVNATNSVGTSAWSNPVFNFTTMDAQPPAQPTLATPANNAISVAVNATLSWNTSIGATSYQLQVSNSQSFTSTLYNQSNITGTSQSVSGLDYITTYYWRVNATNSVGTSAWSTVWSFNTDSIHSNPQGDEIKLYDDSLRAPWNNSSWSSTVILSSSEQVYRGINSIKAVSNAWGALRVISGSWTVPVNTDISGYDSLKLNIYNTTAGLTLRIYLENTAAQTFPQVTIANLALNQWQTISIPTTQLNPNNYPINFVTIQNYTGSEKIFYTDEVTFYAKPKTTVLYSTKIPENFSLKQNYPNPFNPSTTIQYSLSTNSHVTLKIFDLIGQEVITLVNEVQDHGVKVLTWYAEDRKGIALPSGTYVYRLEAIDINNPISVLTETRRMVILK